MKYGDLRCTSNPLTCELKDRNGTTYQFDSDLLPEYFATYVSANASMSQMVFKAEFDDAEIIIAVSLVLLIDQRAMMRPFMGLSFTGQVVNSGQPDGVDGVSWFRWDFSNSFSIYHPLGTNDTVWALEGSFVNLYQGIMEFLPPPNALHRPHNSSSTQLNVGTCQPALITDNVTAEWYSLAVGNGTGVKSYWFSDMHGPLDSEFVPIFSNNKNFMARLPNPSMLLSSNVQVARHQYPFLTHATPTTSLHYFIGEFSRELPPVPCQV